VRVGEVGGEVVVAVVVDSVGTGVVVNMLCSCSRQSLRLGGRVGRVTWACSYGQQTKRERQVTGFVPTSPEHSRDRRSDTEDQKSEDRDRAQGGATIITLSSARPRKVR
jgi:hypothetical protein